MAGARRPSWHLGARDPAGPSERPGAHSGLRV